MRKNLLLATVCLLSSLFFTTCTRENEKQNVIHNAVRDVEGNSYDAVRIGKQVWMKTNLRTKHFRDGSEIPIGEDNVYSDKYPYLYERTVYQDGYGVEMYGLYYNYPVVIDERGLCPKGWHIPSEEEFNELIDYVGSKAEYVYVDYYDEDFEYDPRLIAKAISAPFGWKETEYNGGCPGYKQETTNNSTGFSVVPAGFQEINEIANVGLVADIWSSTNNSNKDSKVLEVVYSESFPYIDSQSKNYGLSVRCIRD